jgi:hypothetical protein
LDAVLATSVNSKDLEASVLSFMVAAFSPLPLSTSSTYLSFSFFLSVVVPIKLDKILFSDVFSSVFFWICESCDVSVGGSRIASSSGLLLARDVDGLDLSSELLNKLPDVTPLNNDYFLGG